MEENPHSLISNKAYFKTKLVRSDKKVHIIYIESGTNLSILYNDYKYTDTSVQHTQL